jgi:hypothetical protein
MQKRTKRRGRKKDRLKIIGTKGKKEEKEEENK